MPKIVTEDSLTEEQREHTDVLNEDALKNIADDARPGEKLPKKLSDGDLKSLQTSIPALDKQMKDLNDQIVEKGGDSELEAQWGKMADELDSQIAQLDNHNAFVARTADREKRLNANRDRFARLDKSTRNRLAGGDSMVDVDVDVDEMHDMLTDNHVNTPAAVSAFLKAHNGKRSWISQEERKACHDMGFDPADREMTIALCNSSEFAELRDVFQAEMEGLHQGSTGYSAARRKARRQMQNALSTDTPTAGGSNVLFGTTFVTTIEEAMLAFGGIYANVDIIRTVDGNPIFMPTVNDTGNAGAMIDEAVAYPPAAGAVVTSADPTFGNMQLLAWLGSTQEIAISNTLLRDNQVMLAQNLPTWLGTRMGRLKNRMGTNGTGVANRQPDGIKLQATQAFPAGAANALTLDEIFDLTYSIDPAIRNAYEMKFMFHDSTRNALRKIKDGEGRYLYQIDARSGAPETLDTHPIVINQDMDEIGAGNRSVLFGNFMAYKFRDVTGGPGANADGFRLVVLNELAARSDQTLYMGWCSFDGRLLNAGDDPVKCIEHP